MHRVLCAVALSGLFVCVTVSRAQEKVKSTGWGSLSGKVTLNGDLPEVVDLFDKMKIHNDKACCLDPKAKPIEKVDPTWIVDKKTKAVANVMVWVLAPKGTYLETHPNLKVRKETVLLDQPHCAFLPRLAAYQPYYNDNGSKVATGQTMIIRNSAVVPHNVRATGHPLSNPGFNKNMPPMTELDVTKDLKPQFLPINVQCDVHPWMGAKLFVFDHPYYAITKEDGSYEIPLAPAGAEIAIMAWHEGVGYVLPEKKEGRKMTLKEGKNTFDFEVSSPK